MVYKVVSPTLPHQIVNTEMPHPTYKKQDEIKAKIFSYLPPKEERGKTWTELAAMAKRDKISKPTLSRYLKDSEDKGLVIREIDATHRPPRPLYRRNFPTLPQRQGTSHRLFQAKVREEYGPQFGDKMFEEDNSLLDEALSTKNRGEAALILADFLTYKLLSAVARVATSYAEASTQQDPNQALQYIRGLWAFALDDAGIGMEAPVLIKHRDIVMTAVTIILQEVCKIPKDRIKELQETLWLPPRAEK